MSDEESKKRRKWILNALDYMGGKAAPGKLEEWLSGANRSEILREVRDMMDEDVLYVTIDWCVARR